MRISKNVNVLVLQGNYGQGWEDEGAYLKWREAQEDLKAYRQNSPYPARVVTRRVPRDKYESGDF